MQAAHFQIFSFSPLSVYILRLLCCTCKVASNFIQYKISNKKKIAQRIYSKWYHKTFDVKTFDVKTPTSIYCESFLAKNTLIYFDKPIINVDYETYPKAVYIHRISLLCSVPTDCVITFPTVVFNFMEHRVDRADFNYYGNGYIFILQVNKYVPKQRYIQILLLNGKINVHSDIIVCTYYA